MKDEEQHNGFCRLKYFILRFSTLVAPHGLGRHVIILRVGRHVIIMRVGRHVIIILCEPLGHHH